LKSDLWMKEWLAAGLLILICLLFAGCGALPTRQPGNSGTPVSPTATSPAEATSMATLQSEIVPARTGSSIAYDEKYKQVILFGGGSYNDTWVWDGQSWTQLFPASVPPIRSDASMAYDAASGQLILFGGVGSTGTALGDTWMWNGTNWLPLGPAVSPPARAQANLVYDAATRCLVLFGGMEMGSGQATTVANDTWTWDGSNWTQEKPKLTPPARAQASMAYDAVTHQVVLFGGTTATKELNDTWAWNGTNWSQLHPTTQPAARSGADLVYDADNGQMVLFAGANATGDLNDTWVWNGTNWKQQTTRPAPAGPYGQAIYNPTQRVIVAYVVQVQNKAISASQTWLWNGKAWHAEF
jgi:hypothetical protein